MSRRQNTHVKKTSRKSSGAFMSDYRIDRLIKPTMDHVYPRMCTEGRDVPYRVNRYSSMYLKNNWFMKLMRGNSIDYQTPYFKQYHGNQKRSYVKNYLTNLLKSFEPKLLQIYKDPEIVKAFLQIEEDQLAKLGPGSLYLPYPEDGPEKFQAVFCDKGIPEGFDEAAFKRALKRLEGLGPNVKLKSISLQDALYGVGGDGSDAMDPDRSACFASYMSRWNKVRVEGQKMTKDLLQYRAYSRDWIVETVKCWNAKVRAGVDIRKCISSFTFTTHQRIQMVGPDPLHPKEKGKTGKRAVCAGEKPEAVFGAQVINPLQDWMKDNLKINGFPVCCAWHPQPDLDERMQEMLNHANANGRAVLSADFSAFDASLPPWYMWRILQAVATWFEPGYARNLFLAYSYTVTFKSGLLTPLGEIAPGPSSLKSGAKITNCGGTIFNMFVYLYGEERGYWKVDMVAANGDDSVGDGPGINKDSFSKCAAEVGLTSHPDKAYQVANTLHYLQKLHIRNFPGGVGSITRIVCHSLVLEDDTSISGKGDMDMKFLVQLLMRLQNGAFNPMFEHVVQWYMEVGDPKYHLGRDMSVDQITKAAGDYYEKRVYLEKKIRPQDASNQKLTFAEFAINRVVRGEKLPPPGVERFKAVYGRAYQSA